MTELLIIILVLLFILGSLGFLIWRYEHKPDLGPTNILADMEKWMDD